MADPEVEQDPSRYFDRVVEIDLDTLEPHLVGPHTPDLARPVGDLGAEAEREGWPLEPSAALVGSCTNSSYEDITRAASIARQAAARGLKVKTELLVTPGSRVGVDLGQALLPRSSQSQSQYPQHCCRETAD